MKARDIELLPMWHLNRTLLCVRVIADSNIDPGVGCSDRGIWYWRGT